MTWVCAECGSHFLYFGPVVKDGLIIGQDVRCSKDESHRGQIKKEDWERKEARHEVAQQDIEDMFGPEDMR